VIDRATRELIDQLLLERISLAGIKECYSGLEGNGCFPYVNEKYAGVLRSVQVTSKKKEG
jgi:hypothetical protein